MNMPDDRVLWELRNEVQTLNEVVRTISDELTRMRMEGLVHVTQEYYCRSDEEIRGFIEDILDRRLDEYRKAIEDLDTRLKILIEHYNAMEGRVNEIESHLNRFARLISDIFQRLKGR